MKLFFKTSLTAASFALMGFTASAADHTLVISSWAPPTHMVNANVFPEMTRMIEEATDGRVTAEIKYGLGSPPAQFDLILDGAADITWIFHGYSPGRFVTTKMAELPGFEGNAEASSVAAWRAYDQFFAEAGEHRGVKVLAMMTHGPGVLHTSTQISTLDEVAGLKLRLGGGVSGDVGAALGATGIRVPAPKVYETLASHSADGVMMPMESKNSFKLYEVAKHSFSVPGGFYRGSFALIMNQGAFDGMSAEDQAALDAIFGEVMSRMAGQAWDEADAVGSAAIAQYEGNTLTEASAEDIAKWQTMIGPLIESVKAEIEAKGIDASAAYDFIVAQMAAP